MIFNKLLLAGLMSLILVNAGCRKAKEEGFPYEFSSSAVQITMKQSSLTATQSSVYLIKAGDIEGRAVLSSVSTSSAGQSMVNSQIVGVKSSYDNMRAPYGGQITAVIGCAAKKYVKEQSLSFAGMKSQMILTVANGRRLFGNCSIEQIQYAGAFWSAYDVNRKQVLSIKLFKPVTHSDKIEESQQEILNIFKK